MKVGRPIILQFRRVPTNRSTSRRRFNLLSHQCRQRAEPWPAEDRDLLALEALVAHQSRMARADRPACRSDPRLTPVPRPLRAGRRSAGVALGNAGEQVELTFGRRRAICHATTMPARSKIGGAA